MTRLGQYTVVLWVAVSLNFLLPRLMPGNPLALLGGADIVALTPEQRASLLAGAALDRPLPVQYGHYLRDLARGHLGYSYQRRTAVGTLIAERLPWTLLLTVSAEMTAILLGIALGVLAAWQRRADAPLLAIIVAIDALPVFWVAMVLLALFAVAVPIFPVFGAVTPWEQRHGVAWVMDVARHLVLPFTALVIGGLAGPFLVTRAAMQMVLGQPLVAAARARGVTDRRILWRHGLRNALVPVTTFGALNMASAIGGALLVETVFSYPGVGRLLYEAVLGRDYPVIQGVFLVITVTVIATNALVDASHVWLDPRLRREQAPAGAGR
jgi:peptide/nickel transport system permease protein